MGVSSSHPRTTRQPHRTATNSAQPQQQQQPYNYPGQRPQAQNNYPATSTQRAPPPPQQQQQQQPSVTPGGPTRVREGQKIKQLVTVDRRSVRFNTESLILSFKITSTTNEFSYEVHTGIREVIKGGEVQFLPNRSKPAPTVFKIEQELDGEEMIMLLDEEVEHMHPDELIWAPKYPKHYPCIIAVKWKDPDNGSPAIEYTYVNLGAKDQQTDTNAANRPKNPGYVHKQMLAVDKSVYLVEQLFGGEHQDGGDDVGLENRDGSELVLGEVADDSQTADDGGVSPAAGNITAVVDSDDDEGLCVICLCEPKDTCCIPCRHLCLCRGCANELQKHSPRCPVCRQPFGQLLHLGS